MTNGRPGAGPGQQGPGQHGPGQQGPVQHGSARPAPPLGRDGAAAPTPPTPDAASRWQPSGPLDLRATLAPLQHGPSDPTLVFVGDEMWRAVRLPSGAATVRMRGETGTARASTRQLDPRDRRLGGTTRGRLLDPAHGDRLRIEAWGPGADEAVDAAPAWAGALDDWADFDHPGFASRLPDSVGATRRARPGLRLPSGGCLMDTLVAIILEQRVTGLEAHAGWARLVHRYGEPAPGPRMPRRQGDPRPLMLPPTGPAWRSVPSWEWHAARVDAARRDALVAVARRESAWRRLEDRRPTGPTGLEGLEPALRSIPGIGVWTAAETLQRTHGSPDHVSFGDVHVAHHVGQALTGRRVDDLGMERLLAPWTGHRQRVVRLIAASGAANPSYGPRLAPNDHRWH